MPTNRRCKFCGSSNHYHKRPREICVDTLRYKLEAEKTAGREMFDAVEAVRTRNGLQNNVYFPLKAAADRWIKR